MAADLLHLVDPARPRERLWVAVADEGVTLASALDHPVLRWRAVSRVQAIRPRAVVAWSRRALGVALRAGFGPIFYRPEIGRRPPTVRRGVILLCRGEAEMQRSARAGWAADQLCLLPDPIPAAGSLSRADVGFLPDDFLWLLPGTGAGLSRGIWAGALMHVLERHSPRQHRLVIPGDGAVARQAKRLIDQLGLPGMSPPVTTYGYAELAPLVDAALFTPKGFADPWHARVARANRLPIVMTPNVDICGELKGFERVWRVPSDKPREITREMGKVPNVHEAREPAPPDVERVRQTFSQLVA